MFGLEADTRKTVHSPVEVRAHNDLMKTNMPFVQVVIGLRRV